MNLYQIAFRNLSRRKSKVAFMLLGLIIGSATIIAIHTTTTMMQTEISKQLSDLGANIIITADSGELSFQYGGITIPELIFDSATLSETDLRKIEQIPEYRAITAVSPKLIGTVTVGGYNLVIAGIYLPAEFAVKPWLRFSDQLDNMQTGQQDKSDNQGMDFELLDLERTTDIPELAANQVVLGSAVAELLALDSGDLINFTGRNYRVLATLDETGMAEDNQVLMNLDESRELLNRPGELTVIELAADFNKVAEDEIINQLHTALPAANVSGVRQAVMGRDDLLATFSRFGTFAGGLVILTGTLIVVLTMSASVRERTREIGIFRAIGFRGTHIFTIIATESILISAVGGVIGYHSGLLAAIAAAPIVTGSSIDISTWQLSTLLLTIIITSTAGALAGFYPALIAAKLDPAEALRFV